MPLKFESTLNIMQFQDKPESKAYFLRLESLQGSNSAEKTYLRAQQKLAEDELCRLDSELAILLAKRSRVIRYINRCHTSLAPYSKLPTELIEVIIELSIPVLQPLPPSDGKNDSRLQITQICSARRKVAFGIPGLWNVCLNRYPRRTTVSLMAAWIRQCSSTHTVLQVSLDLDAYAHSTPAYLVTDVRIPHAHRFKALYFLPMNPGDFPSVSWDVLTTLSFDFLWGGATGIASKSIIAPSLRAFRGKHLLDVSPGKLLSTLPKLPWEQLTVLSLDGRFRIGDAHEILLQCTSLVHCEFNSILSDSPGLPPNALVGLPHLKSLWIKIREPSLFYRLFSFSVPNLSCLTISYPSNRSEFLTKFTSFMNMLQNTLLYFELLKSGSSYELAPMEAIIQTIPSVTHLLTTISIPRTALEKIGGGDFLPNIEVMRFHQPRNCSLDEILDLLIPQHPSGTTSLRDITVYTSYSSHIAQRIKGLLNQGIHISLLKPRNKFALLYLSRTSMSRMYVLAPSDMHAFHI